ncbi:Trichosetin biosynthesis cluster transcription factor TF23 [Metarhizium brunneum]|uniref:Trichosetin biosynthesis cluster transcription factor TF23 n=1 Tax=Metarhizium brunneum TaxID=500148 RepID=A0A7D5Z905_9HYPO
MAPDHATAGKLHVDDSKTAYVGGSHWKAVLESISELKTLSEEEPDDSDRPSPEQQTEYGLEDSILIPGTTRERPRLLYGWHKPASVADILAAMPEKSVVDRLVSSYFSNPPIPHVLLHPGSFSRQYERFWADPFNTPLTWIALLYGIMCLATQAETFQSLVLESSLTPQTPVPSMPPSRPQYLDQVEQSLIAGNYSNGGPFALEALLHYTIVEQTRYPDADVGTWLLTGVIVRLGLRMGYHRDPSHFPGITPFQGEMRRRIWVVMHALDVMTSLLLGLPRVIKDGQWDTMPPRNVHDSELDEGAARLPPSRPESEATPVLHLLAKHRMLVVLGAIADTSMSVAADRCDASALETERRMIARLREAYDSVPVNAKFDAVCTILSSRPSDMLNRLSITMLLQKGLIVLNWRHVMPTGSVMSPDDPVGRSGGRLKGDTEGYQICIQAALEILTVQETIDRETRPGGLLFPLTLLLYSVVKHEFLMATTVLITHMYRAAVGRPDIQQDSRERMLSQQVEVALRKSHEIWIRHSARSREAQRVANLLSVLFRKLQDADIQGLCKTRALDQTPGVQSDDQGLALFGEFGLLHHLEDLSVFFDLAVT